jgi:integrase
VQIIGEAQIEELLAKLKGRALYTKVVVALFTGIRRGELLGLRWSDIDTDAKTMHIERSIEQIGTTVRIKEPKTKAGTRTISLPDIVIDVLRDHRRSQLELRMALGQGRLPDDAFIFVGIDGEPPKPFILSTQWIECARVIGMPHITWHSFRHSHASLLISAGMDVVQIARRLGHSSPAITLGTYSHMFKKIDTAADVINAALAKLGPNR